MVHLKIREFRVADYEDVARLWLDSGLGFRLGDDLDSVKVKVTRDPELFLVAEEGGRLVGTVMGAWDGRRGWIYHLGVLPGSRRKGVGRALVEEIESRMREKGVLKVNGLVYGWNRISLSFFREQGYQVQTMKEVEKQLVEWKHELVAPRGGRSTGPGGGRPSLHRGS
ncbi:MAG TPA: GNAT family N-acetyltransferase [Conexivisphaerales archaeon]|nr:GNAT family N-acetyltransferase [Conexivisphaerales archaeon]